MQKYAYRLIGNVCFPEGIMPGEGKESNILSVARNGLDQPVLRGTAIAGAMRNACKEAGVAVDHWFGNKQNNSIRASMTPSKVIIADMVLSSDCCNPIVNRTHNMINRHTGTVVEKTLFSMEALIPDVKGKLLIYIIPGNEKDLQDFIETLGKMFGNDLMLGGNRNRGMGRMNCESSLYLKCFSINTIKGYSEWMNTRYEDRNSEPPTIGEPIKLSRNDDHFVFNVRLAIPRGEDLVVGYGVTNEAQSEPQSVIKADGKEYWRIPGSTFRGAFYGWMSRIAAIGGVKLRNCADEYYEGKLNNYSKNLGWGFVSEETRKSLQEKQKQMLKMDEQSRHKIQNEAKAIIDPLMDLFGSLYKKGRIHFADAFSEKPVNTECDVQLRTHVAIDRFSGGANEGMLYTNKVLVGDVKFNLRISLISPKNAELDWLEKTFKALHNGLFSIGSSKGSGRLEIIECKTFSGGDLAENVSNRINEFVRANNG